MEIETGEGRGGTLRQEKEEDGYGNRRRERRKIERGEGRRGEGRRGKLRQEKGKQGD